MDLKIGTTAFSAGSARRSWRRAIRGASIVALGMILGASVAQARTETLRWTHSEASRVSRFEAHIGPSSGNYDRVINLGVPSPNGSGVRSADVTVGDNEDVYVALRAIGNDGTTSPFSVQRQRLAPAPPTPPAPPTDPTPPPTDPTPPPTNPSPPPTGGSTSATFFDFEPGSTATNSWYDTQPNNSLAGDDSLFSLYATGAGSVLGTSSTASNIHSHVVPHLASDTNYSVQAVVSVSTAQSGIGVTAYSNFPTSDSYYRLGRLGGGSFRIEGHPNFSCSSGNSDTGVIPAAGASYGVLLRVADEGSRNRIEATVWALGNAQPAAQAVCFDDRTNRPRRGTVGVWATGGGAKYWDSIQVESLGTLDPPVLIGISRIED
jgi:hypothetical protein